MDLPAFLSADPAFWFTLVESIFTSRKVTSVREKFNAILLALPSHLQLETKPFLSRFANLTDQNAAERGILYEDLKKKIISITSIPEEQRLQELLHGAHIGTKTPSQFLNYLRNLQGDAGDRDNKYIRWIFLQNLPIDIRNIIISQQRENLDEMANTADLLWQKPNGNIAHFLGESSVSVASQKSDLIQKITEAKSSNISEIRELRQSVATLTKQMGDMLTHFVASIDSLKLEINQLREKQCYVNNKAPNSTAMAAGGLPGNDTINPNFNAWCYFHQQFGRSAFKCSQPCNFNQSNQGN